jgi:hypothetical protein
MAEPTRQEREEKVVETVREWLPELVASGSAIQITACDPNKHDGAMFSVSRSPVFACRRGPDYDRSKVDPHDEAHGLDR